MNSYLSKSDQARQLIAAGEVKAALALVSTFRLGITREQLRVLKTGYECHHFADTYRQMGIDPEQAIQKAWALLTSLTAITGKNSLTN